jgi:hypothetical protein
MHFLNAPRTKEKVGSRSAHFRKKFSYSFTGPARLKAEAVEDSSNSDSCSLVAAVVDSENLYSDSVAAVVEERLGSLNSE